MKYKKLGKSGIEVSEIGFGAWTIALNWWGKEIEEDEAKRMLKKAYDCGINFFETGDMYGKGKSERLIGETFKDMRNEVVISTKYGYDFESADQIGHKELPQKFDDMFTRHALEKSLERLQTNFVDMYGLHNPKMTHIHDDQIFKTLDNIAKKGAILATNTSALDVNEIAAQTSRPEDVIGLHFFSPANVMRLLEIVRGEKTSKSVVATSMKMAKSIGKVAAVVGVCPGFVGNRILAQRQREANKLILEGAMPWEVDDALFDFGFPMGPFAMSDLAGLDIGWDEDLSTGDTLRDKLCEAGRLGQKTGKGFYIYDEKRNKSPDTEVEKLIIEFSEKHQIKRREISKEEILERCLYPMINEGFKILEEGMAIRASDIDIVWINGYGWPMYEGGPMFYGQLIGYDKILKWHKEMEEKFGSDFSPSPYLEKVVNEKINLFG